MRNQRYIPSRSYAHIILSLHPTMSYIASARIPFTILSNEWLIESLLPRMYQMIQDHA